MPFCKAIDWSDDWGLGITVGRLDVILFPHERLWFWGYDGTNYYDGYWHVFGLGPFAHITWGPT